MIICDTDVVIEFLKGNEATNAVLKKENYDIALSAITIMELFYGALNKKELKKIKSSLSAYPILSINEEITEIAIDLVERYSKSHQLRIPDALIAATAIWYNLKLFTFNTKDFRYIKDLMLY